MTGKSICRNRCKVTHRISFRIYCTGIIFIYIPIESIKNTISRSPAYTCAAIIFYLFQEYSAHIALCILYRGIIRINGQRLVIRVYSIFCIIFNNLLHLVGHSGSIGRYQFILNLCRIIIKRCTRDRLVKVLSHFCMRHATYRNPIMIEVVDSLSVEIPTCQVETA